MAKLRQEIESTEMKKSLLYFENMGLNRRLGEARSYKKMSGHYLIYSKIGLMTLSIALTTKMSSAAAKKEML